MFWNDPFALLMLGIGTETFCPISAGGFEVLDIFSCACHNFLLLVKCKVAVFTLVLSNTCTGHSSHRILFLAANVDIL
jgi:hypothetical protein